MNDKFKKKKNVSKKSIIFWSLMGLILLTLLTVLIVKVAQTREISSYNKLEMITGPDLFNQDDEKYFVLVYNYNGEKDLETFDKSMFKYFTYHRDNGKATNIYGMDIDENQNKPCLITTESKQSVSGATEFPNRTNGSNSTVLKIYEENTPMLLVISGGSVTEYKTGENEIMSYIKDQMK